MPQRTRFIGTRRSGKVRRAGLPAHMLSRAILLHLVVECAHPTDISYCSQCSWVALFFACCTKLAVGIVSLRSGVIFHSRYQMGTRWVIVASASARGPTRTHGHGPVRALTGMVLQRNTPSNYLHLFPPLITREKKEKEEKNLPETSFP